MPSMSFSWILPVLFLALAAASDLVSNIVVLGATGRTGSLLYHELTKQHKGGNVRDVVRSIDKARLVLGCHTCDEEEGIYQGDVTNVTSLLPAFQNVQTVAIVSGVSGRGSPTDEQVRNVEFGGVQNAVRALAQDINQQTYHGTANLRVVLCSSRGTTRPNSGVFGNILFYKLNAEAFLGSVGMVTSIVKPCGLSSTNQGHNSTLLALHDDAPTSTGSQMIARFDVARVMAEIILHPREENLRFDLCSIEGPPTEDLASLVDSGKWAWKDHHGIKGENSLV